MNIKKIDGLHPYEYEHSFDAKALDALQHTPGLDILIRQFNKYAIEKMITVQNTGSNLHITTNNYPKIYGLLETTCEVLNLPALPDLYLSWGYSINGFTIGVENPIIVLNSGAVDLLSDDELLYLIGHEVGHIKSRHTLYHQIGQFFPLIADFIGAATLGISNLLSTPLKLALLQWSRMSELTADRAGLLACQNVETAASVMIKWAGTPIKYHGDIKIDHFIDQAERFKRFDYDNLNKIIKFFSIIDESHPWTVMRTAELISWINSGEYQNVMDRKTKNRVNMIQKANFSMCRSCRAILNGSENFCGKCGAQINQE